ncbi:MAG: hypothetical protein JNM57_01455 [Cyclobacteriaceae bacterium]|nr:hypothetical protein [Cyclobacteriaceae bacterium]
MSIRKANTFYQELTPQQKHFVDNKTINTTLSVRHWISFLSKTSAFDEYGDKARTILSARIAVIVAVIIGFVIAAFSSGIYYLFLVPAVLGIFLFQAIQSRKNFTNRDINNYLRLFFMPFLETIRQKAGDEAKLSASLDFRDPFKVITPQPEKITVAGRKRDVNLYEHKIVIAGVTLTEDSYLETVLLDEIRKISYRNANGKSKSKTKTLHRLFIRLTVSKNVYTRTGASLPENIEYSETPDQFVFKLKDREKELTYGILTPGVFFGALSSIYQYIQPLRGTSIEGMAAAVSPPLIPTVTERIAEALIWDDILFNRYDYDGVSRRGSGIGASDGESRNIFDS